jgi:Fe2+ transport system protein FeoA
VANYLNPDDLAVPRLREADVEVQMYDADGNPFSGMVRVRGLSRLEAIHVQSREGADNIERHLLELGMVEPRMTQAQVGAWQKASPGGEMEVVTDKISELSGMKADSTKKAMQEMEDNPEAEFPVSTG